jgi:hypothetical protein
VVAGAILERYRHARRATITQVLEDSHGELRARAERDLDAGRDELARVCQESGTADVPAQTRRRLTGWASEGS